MKGHILRVLLSLTLLLGGMMLTSYRYQSHSLGFAVEIPDEWELGEAADSDIMVVLSPVEGEEDLFRENMNIIVTKLDVNVSLRELYNLNVANAKQMLNNFQIVEVELMEINGVQAIKLIYTFQYEQTLMKNIVYLLLHKGTMYTMTFSSLDHRFNEFRPLFETIARSFQPR